MATASDELRHTAGPEPNWQENYLFLGWDEDTRSGIYLHLAHVPSKGVVDLRALTSVGDRRVCTFAELPADEALGAPGVTADIEVPLERWHLRLDTHGVAGSIHDGFLPDATGGIPMGFDLTFQHAVPPVDWDDAWAAIGIPDVMTSHYEGGAGWSGTVWAGEEARTVSGGLLVRDHSWGPRDFSGSFDVAWWWPTAFTDGSFITGVSILREDRWVGFVMEERGNGPQLLSDDPWVRPDGQSRPLGYESAALLVSGPTGAQPYRFESRLHIPIDFRVMGNNLLEDVLGWMTAPDGRVGVGSFEINNTKRPESS